MCNLFDQSVVKHSKARYTFPRFNPPETLWPPALAEARRPHVPYSATPTIPPARCFQAKADKGSSRGECCALQAYVVHATFQRHHTSGKRARLREEGLWRADPPAYFTAARLLAYSSGARSYVTALQAAAARPLPDLLKHLHAMSYQLAELRDAFAMAAALNRTLVGSPPALHALHMHGACLRTAHAALVTVLAMVRPGAWICRVADPEAALSRVHTFRPADRHALPLCA